MKLITAIAALALLAVSMDVEAQKRGKVGKPGDSDDDAPQIAPVAHMAIGAFGVLDPEERKGLAEAAEEGDEEALEELRAERVEAIEAMIEAMEDPASRKLIELGMTFNIMTLAPDDDFSMAERAQTAPGQNAFPLSLPERDVSLTNMLDMVQEQLEAQLDNFNVKTGVFWEDSN